MTVFVGFMGTTPPTHACAVRFMNFGAETKFEKGASDRNSLPVCIHWCMSCYHKCPGVDRELFLYFSLQKCKSFIQDQRRLEASN